MEVSTRAGESESKSQSQGIFGALGVGVGQFLPEANFCLKANFCLLLLKPQKCNKIVTKFSMQMLIPMYNVNLSF